MKEKETLVLFVADYPNPKGEPFLEEELKIIAPLYKRVFLIQTSHTDFDSATTLFLPSNVHVFALDRSKPISVFNKWKGFFTFSFLYQLFLAKFKHKATFSLPLLKLINYYSTSSVETIEFLQRFIRQEEIDLKNTLFYAYWCDEHTFALAKMKQKFSDFEFVTRVHGWDLYFERHTEKFLPYREFIFKYARTIFPISKDGRRYLFNKRLCSHPEKVITSFLGVQPIKQNPNYQQIEKISSVTKTWKILTLSHINHVKRLDKLVDALSQLPDDFHVEWHHIGWGEPAFEMDFKQFVKNTIKDHSNVKVIFHGMFSKSQVQSFLENQPIDVVVNCSDTEGIPVSLMEAASASIPVIAFNVGGVPAIILNNYNGILLDSSLQNPNMLLRDALVSFFTLPFAERWKMSQHAKKLWETEFNVTTNFNQFATYLHDSVSNASPYLACTRCLVNSKVHPAIVLNKYGECDICEIIDAKNENLAQQNKVHYFENLLQEIIKKGKAKKYDCLIGISGGVDSAYLAIKMKALGLNPLLVHVDNGWNSEIAVSNIEKLVTTLGFDLYTVVIDWEEIQDVVRSFMQASVIDIDWANEMCFVSSLYKIAQKFGIKAILTGHQLSSEGWMPETVVHYKLDLLNFKAIHRKFGKIPLKTYPTIGYLKSYYYNKFLGIQYYYPLDYIGYDKMQAKQELIEAFGWRDYGQKHFESIFTRFYQAYLLPRKFGIDKRVFHYSALITSKQLTREEGKVMLEDDSYFTSGQWVEDEVFIRKKLGFSAKEFQEILASSPKSHFDYASILHFSKDITRFKRRIMGL
jgi:N-acetyl sugar amidotransferase